jgi:demethylmenaquinone methyltransferase/2-methoxy-6-polyprenyl-1,4-benzoquinol methylase
VLNLNSYHRADFFEKLAPSYDLLLDLLTFGNYAKFIRKGVRVLNPQKGDKILDLCSGTGRAASWMAEAVGEEGRVIGMDIAKSMIDVAGQRYGKTENLIFLKRDVTRSWDDIDLLDGIFISFALHELPEKYRSGVLEQSYSALKEKGRMVIADFNPHVSGIARVLSLIFFNLFERRNLNFFEFRQNEALKRAGFKKIKTFPVSGGILQITLAQKNESFS